ncbi:hypothetical protein [Bacillus atrophaeus]|uniref:hypothetical protein n=1 Tax=Bacillus atrophaeus TaxID=1452 RepID=UPI00077A3AA6|nr:hypothetical protein [Bacillus atrophaeus]KXZ13299.1 hypothetical protein AXI57_16215 [Bacillus atrophaeus]MED4806290.1 hypothetical protein [Bacillus atrophaeus]UFD97593.1 hypothetical protein [Bacillus atrophaeus]GED04293.1 hypothetical protein BAT02nite_39370 [Bacillus atrophaeus]
MDIKKGLKGVQLDGWGELKEFLRKNKHLDIKDIDWQLYKMIVRGYHTNFLLSTPRRMVN